MTLSEVLYQSLRHFVHLDEANAAIHCAEVRYSPITFRLAEELEQAGGQYSGDQAVVRVIAHLGKYEEDKGR